jgi:hypothetical protein
MGAASFFPSTAWTSYIMWYDLKTSSSCQTILMLLSIDGSELHNFTLGTTPVQTHEKRVMRVFCPQSALSCSYGYHNKCQAFPQTALTVTLIFQFLTNKCTFLFLFNSPYLCFGRDSAIIRGTLISSLHCSQFHLVLSHPLECLRLLFTLAITTINSFFK